MKEYLYSLTSKRKLNDGNYVTYMKGVLHPDRTMKDHDFIYMLEGEWEIWMDQKPYLMKAGDVLMLRAGVHHFSKELCLPGTKIMFLHIKEEESCGLASFPPLISCGHAPQIKDLFSSLISLHHNRSTYVTDSEITASLNLLLCQLFRIAEDSRDIEKYSVVSEAVKIMESRPEYFYSLSEITDLLNVSVKTLNKKFHEVFDMSAYQYQMDLKLKAVHSFLTQHPDEKLKTAAQNFGFYDEFYLSKMYKKKYGISPSAARTPL